MTHSFRRYDVILIGRDLPASMLAHRLREGLFVCRRCAQRFELRLVEDSMAYYGTTKARVLFASVPARNHR